MREKSKNILVKNLNLTKLERFQKEKKIEFIQLCKMVKKNACVFISGFGSNLKSLIFNSRNVNFPINVKLVVSNNPKAPGLLYAKKYSIPFLIINTKR